MNRNIFKISAAWLLAIIGVWALTACSDDLDVPDSGDAPSGLITLTLNIPDFETQAVESRAVNESGVRSVTILGYDASNVCRSFNTYGSDNLTIDGSSVRLNITLPKGVCRIEIAANADKLLTGAPTAPLSSVFNTEALSSASHLIFWGRLSMSELLSGSPSANLLRQSAKVTFVNKAQGFSSPAIRVCATAASGSVAPNLDEGGNPIATFATDDNYASSSEAIGEGMPVYIYETPADKPYIILSGTYQGNQYFYKVGFFNPGTNTRVPIRRNHHYQLTVKEVLGTGCLSEAEAAASDFSNRLVVELRDNDERIYNLVGNNDYALGVGDDIEAAATATSVDLPVIVIAASDALFAAPTVSIDPAASAWITGASVGDFTSVTDGNYSSPARAYTVKLTLKPNGASTLPRSGLVTVRFRDLQQSLNVTQAGTDFKRDAARKVIFQVGGSNLTSDYFDWIDNSVKGISPAAMQGAVRNEGLHFSTETDAASQAYLIPFISGDVLKGVARSDISVTRSGNYWLVKLNNGASAATQMWISSLTITNAAGIDIVYPVYRTGVFHNISASAASTYQVPDAKKSGWFYYETVAVKGKDGNTYYILDRNLGAEGNGPFSIATASLQSASNTVGAYYKISNASAGDNIKPQICPAGFTVPSADALTQIGFTAGKFTTLTGEEYNSASVTTVNSQIQRIYIPTGGYTEGDNYKNTNHANVWSSTYLSGAQGFSPSSPEFRYWFLYFDSHGTIVDLSNMRFVNGGGGTMGTVYKGMPVRCVRGDSSKPNDGASGGSSQITTIRIYWSNSSTNWNPPYIYTYDSANENTSGAWPGKSMTYSSGAVYWTLVPKGSLLVFNNGSSGKYPSSGGFNAVENHIYGPAGDMGTYASSGIQIFWDNSASTAWSAPTAYYWKSANGSDNPGWPGKAMSRVGTSNIWTYTVPDGYDRVIISNNGSNQTCDMVLTHGLIYSVSNQNTHKAN